MTVRKIKTAWWVDFRADYVRHRIRSPENTRAGAEAYETILRQRLARGLPIGSAARAFDKEPSFEEFAWIWFRDYAVPNNKFSEQRAKRGTLRRHLIPFFGRFAVGSITTHQVEQFKARQVRNGATNKTLRNHLTILRKCLSCAHEWLELQKPLPRIALPKCPPVQTDYLSADECDALLNVAEGLAYELILTTLRTGMRQGEVKGLQWSSIDWQNRSLVVRHSHCDVRGVLDTPKSGRARHIPIDIDVLAVLHRRKKATGYVFTYNGKPLRGTQLNRLLAALCQTAGLRRITWHTLRHTFATNLAMRGVPLQIVQHLLGHSTVKTTERYAHVAPSMLRVAIDMMNPKTQLDHTFGQPVGNQWDALHTSRQNSLAPQAKTDAALSGE